MEEIDQFDKELGMLLKRFSLEYNLTYAEIIGVMEQHKMDLAIGRWIGED